MTPRNLTRTIASAVAAFYDLEPEEITRPCRQRRVAYPRQVAMYLTREIRPTITYEEIALRFGHAEHSSAIYAYQQVRIRSEVYPDFAAELDQVTELVMRQLEASGDGAASRLPDVEAALNETES